jgi:hypothetical protein
MARPIRVEYTGAGYPVTARGNERKAICRDNAARLRFLETVEEAVTRFRVVVPSYWLDVAKWVSRSLIASGCVCL